MKLVKTNFEAPSRAVATPTINEGVPCLADTIRCLKMWLRTTSVSAYQATSMSNKGLPSEPPMRPAAAYRLSRDHSTAFWLIDNLWLPLATGVQTGGAMTMIEQVCATGIGGPPTHRHVQDEGFYVIEGQCTFNAGGITVTATENTFVSVPRDTDHSFTVDQPGTRVLNFYLPAGFEHILMSLAVPAPRRETPPRGATEMPPRWMAEEVAREFGQTSILGVPFADPPGDDNMATQPSPTNPVQPLVAKPADSPQTTIGGITIGTLASAVQTGGQYSITHWTASKDHRTRTTIRDHDQAFYVLDGSIQTFIDGNVFDSEAGTFIWIPAGCVGSLKVTAGARLLHWASPGGWETILQPDALPESAAKLSEAPQSAAVDFALRQAGIRPVRPIQDAAFDSTLPF